MELHDETGLINLLDSRGERNDTCESNSTYTVFLYNLLLMWALVIEVLRSVWMFTFSEFILGAVVVNLYVDSETRLMVTLSISSRDESIGDARSIGLYTCSVFTGINIRTCM